MTSPFLLAGPKLLSWRRGIVFTAAAATGIATWGAGAGEGVDRLLRNARDNVRSHSASGEVHIVEIDARSLAAIERWPWPRGIHARVIDGLHQAGARTIAFDVDFSARSVPAEDAKLAAALRRAGGTVVLATFRQYAGSGASDYIDSLPTKAFTDNAFLAAVNVVPDPDGYVRRMPLGVETGGVPRPSLASMVAEQTAQIGRSFEIDFAIEPETIPRHSVIDLIEGRVPAAELAGKRVIIGATAVEMGDRYAVPRHGVIPGVVIQAMAAETLLTGRVPQSWNGFLALMLALAVIAWTMRPGSRLRRVLAAGAAATLLMLMPLVTESLFAISPAIAPVLAAFFAAAVAAAALIGIERFRASALTDAGTGLPNLAAMEREIAARDGVNVVLARIDRFATIASGLGPAGTTLLVQRIAERLRFANAGRDIYRTDEASLAWVETPGDEASLDDRIDAIAAVMRAPVECGRLVDVSLSFGFANGSLPAKQLVANAALAAQHAVQKGVRCDRFSDADLDEADWHLALLGELDTAMATGQIWNAYQPKLQLATGRITAAEALVRWSHPERGPIPPDRFIPVLENAGRIRDLTAHVLAQALEDALHWQAEGHPLGVAVNVSANLLTDHAFIEQVGQILTGSALPTERVTIEVTETAAMANPERAIAALESWRSLGVGISIDDYGTGQSSLGYLQKLPATELKIDRSFVDVIAHDRRNAIMVRSTIALAHELGMKVVAEGIETEECLAALREMGCDTGQGYLIGHPIAAQSLLDLVAEQLRDAA